MDDNFRLGYCLGLIVGEGSFTGSSHRRAPVLSVAMVLDQEPLEELQRCFGGNIYIKSLRGELKVVMWTLSGHELRQALSIFDKYLPQSRKREQYEAWKIKYNDFFLRNENNVTGYQEKLGSRKAYPSETGVKGVVRRLRKRTNTYVYLAQVAGIYGGTFNTIEEATAVAVDLMAQINEARKDTQ
jgi:hypothetical protein